KTTCVVPQTMQENTTTATASTSTAPTGPRTDRLEIVKEMVRGSIGQVHKARSPQQDRVTALRQFQVPQWLDDVKELMSRILAEARAASALEHPNIARFYTCGYKDFNVFMTAEFVEGQNLKEVMAGRVPDLDEILGLARQLLSALDYAHDKGVFHHFLNPSNIKVLSDGTIKVLDFGLLRDKNILTQTPAKKLENEPYLSPEQVNNRQPTRAANIFSAAIILYELYTTRNPFGGKHLGEVDRAIADAMPHPLNVANGRVPEAISRVVLKGLAKNPADRFQNGAQFVSALESAMREPRPVAPATGKFAAAPATGKFPAMDTASIKAKAPSGPGTTRVKVAVPPPTSTGTTFSGKIAAPTSPANQWKLVGLVVGGLVLVAGLGMLFQRRPADLSAGTEAVPAALQLPLEKTKAPEQAANAPATPAAEPEQVTRSAPPRSTHTGRAPRAAPQPVPAAPSQGQVAVGSLPLGATVEIAGQAGRWQTPQVIGPLAAGTYNVTFSKPGFAPETRSIQVNGGGRVNLDVKLTPTKGWLTLSGSPVGAAIVIDGRDTGKSTPAELMLDPAAHSVSLRKPGYLEASTEIKVAAGQAVSYSPTLMVAGRTDNIKIVSSARRFGNGGSLNGSARIEIKSEPKGAQVLVNGTPLQKTTPVEIQVDAGTYDITLQKEGFKPVHESAIVGVDDRVKIEKSLSR
ncbi:MAG TPA: serine/threonine-protein kinase, partial [Terriglobales bacterium]|nr:serine/threonine-protein kinase [Terriglobales bacterium]